MTPEQVAAEIIQFADNDRIARSACRLAVASLVLVPLAPVAAGLAVRAAFRPLSPVGSRHFLLAWTMILTSCGGWFAAWRSGLLG